LTRKQTHAHTTMPIGWAILPPALSTSLDTGCQFLYYYVGKINILATIIRTGHPCIGSYVTKIENVSTIAQTGYNCIDYYVTKTDILDSTIRTRCHCIRLQLHKSLSDESRYVSYHETNQLSL